MIYRTPQRFHTIISAGVRPDGAEVRPDGAEVRPDGAGQRPSNRLLWFDRLTNRLSK
ncbi:MAG: hypothetical protein LBS86_01580 [Treponema sp.]|jgi:hypothetical protein|nr:hypothetical protein [Treponema sp.]